MNRITSSLFIFLFSFTLQAQILHVKADASGANNGLSWADAYTDLQSAISTASSGTQIWVAVGTYKPTSGTDRDAYFELKNGVEIYGGFLGTETQLAERDYIHNESILSGDIGVVGDSLDNSYTIVYSIGTDENTILEGFTIQDGNADYTGTDVLDTDPRKSGGGMYLSGEMTDLRCQIKHCHFKNNHSDARGGGLFVWSGAAAGSTRPNIFANEFTQNDAGTLGGGFYWIGGTTLQAELIPADSLIFNNNNANVGGGIHMTSRVNNALTKIRNCSFAENISSSYGGGLYFREDSFDNVGTEFEGCDFTYNTSAFSGGGIFHESFYEFKNITLRDCYLDHNVAGTIENPVNGGGIFIGGYIDTPNPNAKVLIDNTTMSWNAGNYGGAINPSITGAVVIEVTNSTFQYNSAAFSGGGIYTSNPDHTLRVSNSYFEGNAANDATGGGIHVQSSDVKITNSVFQANIGKTGAGIRMINGEISNCVFYENNAVQQGGGIRCQQAMIANCIFWNNINFGTGPDIYNNSFPLTVESCLFSSADCAAINYINSNISCSGNTLFGIDPLFTNPTIGDFSVPLNSIVRDAGDNTLYHPEITEDYFGNMRIQGSSIDIGVYELPVVSITSVTGNASDCQEESINIGSINYEIADGVTPLTLTIGDVQEITDDITGTITGLAGGTFDFTVTDAVGNSATQSVVIQTLPQPTIGIDLTLPTCNAFTNGVLVLDPQGETAPFSVIWDDGTESFGQYGVGAGMYSYTLTDAFGCVLTGTETITEPSAVILNETIQNTICVGDATGQVSINPTGGTGMLTAVWSPNPNNEEGYELTNITSGVYAVIVTDESGCAFGEQYIVESGSAVEISAEITDAGCSGTATGAITVTPVTGEGELTYAWSNEMTGATISDIFAGNYNVTVTDEIGCQTVETYTVFAGAPITFSPTIMSNTCAGATEGSIDLNVEDTNGLNFTWSPNVVGQTGTVLTELAADTYFLTITDGDECPSYAEYTISEPSEIELTPLATNPSCLGGSDGTITIFAEGGTAVTPEDYVFEVTPSLIEGANGVYSGAAAGEYQLIVTDLNGCTVESTITLEEGEALTINGVVNDIACFAESSGSINLAGDGADGSTYIWSPNANGQTTNIITELAADTYSVTVIDGVGCQRFNEFVVTEPSEMNLISSTENVLCAAGNDGIINITATGGTPFADCGYDYTVSPDLSSPDCGVFTGAVAGTYTLTATDANGCQMNTSVDVIENEALSAIISVADASCPGATDGSVNIEITGGEAPYEINGEVENLGAGEYSVLITDVNNCEFTSTFTVLESAGLTLNFDVIDATCIGASNGSVEVIITGGVAPYTIEGETNDLVAGEYEITASDSNGCGATATFTVSEPSLLSFDFDIINAETSSSMDGSIFIENVIGGTAPYDFEWENGETTEDITNISSGIYNLIITDGNNCTYSFGFEVDYNTALDDLSSLGWEAHLQPNILTNQTNTQLFLKADQNAKGKLHIYDAIGRLSTSQTLNIVSGDQQLTLSTESLTTGVYFVRLEIGGLGSEVLRLVIVD